MKCDTVARASTSQIVRMLADPREAIEKVRRELLEARAREAEDQAAAEGAKATGWAERERRHERAQKQHAERVTAQKRRVAEEIRLKARALLTTEEAAALAPLQHYPN